MIAEDTRHHGDSNHDCPGDSRCISTWRCLPWRHTSSWRLPPIWQSGHSRRTGDSPAAFQPDSDPLDRSRPNSQDDSRHPRPRQENSRRRGNRRPADRGRHDPLDRSRQDDSRHPSPRPQASQSDSQGSRRRRGRRRGNRRPAASQPDRGHRTPLDRSRPASQPPPERPRASRPTSSQPSHRRRRADEARKIQRWYRANKKRCMRNLLGETPTYCDIPAARLEQYFDRPPQHLGQTPPPWLIPELAADPGDAGDLTYPVTKQEVTVQLKRLPWQSSPGPDQVGYQVRKLALQSSSEVLCSIFNTCLINNKVPASWKRSNTILLPKSGDLHLPENWRPISLQPTIYKILAAVMARRLASWAIEGGKLSPAQKGFLPMEGCAEHTFTVESLLEDSKRKKKNLRILWLDLQNAFGSVPHDLLWFMLRFAGVPAHFIDLCREIYSGSTQKVRGRSWTRDLPVGVGIKQGCPLSPLLFNFALEGILPHLMSSSVGYKLSNDTSVSTLGYADDICMVGKTKDDIQKALHLFMEFAEWACLRINPRKCGCLSAINGSKRGCYIEPYSPLAGADHIPALKWEDAYKHLGVPVQRSRQGDPRTSLQEEVLSIVAKILGSRLTDWQKLDAINTFALSKMTYQLSAAMLNRGWAEKLDAEVRRKIKRSFGLPMRTAGAFFHLPQRMGGLGVRSMLDSLDAATVTKTLKCLSSTDPIVSAVAWDQVGQSIHKRTGNKPQHLCDVLTFLNSPPVRGESARGDVRSLWSLARKSLAVFDCKLDCDEDNSLLLSWSTKTVRAGRWRDVGNLLKEATTARSRARMLACSDQGRSFHLSGALSRAHGSARALIFLSQNTSSR